MKTTIDKTITVLLKLTPKYTNLSAKLNEVILSQEENSTINIKLDEILALVNSNSSGESGTDTISDLVALGILTKQVSEYTNADIGSIISIPYNDASGNITGPIEFEVVGINHHKDVNDESKPTITLMSKNILRYTAFDAKEPNNPDSGRAERGNNRWSVSNIRQWLNSNGTANEWFTAQHEYDTAPDSSNVSSANGAYSDESGFLAGFSDDVKSHFATVSNITLIPSVDGSGIETTQDKVFLPSYTEMNIGNLNSSYPEGNALSGKFIDESSRGKTGADGYYWLRSHYPDNPHNVYYVNGYGMNSSDSAFYGNYGVAPLLVLS